jgi:inosine/xanthosine triphosphate pyrophosphatase family protein
MKTYELQESVNEINHLQNEEENKKKINNLLDKALRHLEEKHIRMAVDDLIIAIRILNK